jgi:YbbR domain-containing protein
MGISLKGKQMFMAVWKAVSNNILMKIIALFLAVATWFYVHEEIVKVSNKNVVPAAAVYPRYGSLVQKVLYVKAIFIGQPPDGYHLDVAKVKVDPEYIVVAGPSDVFKSVSQLETEPIDISQMKRATISDVRLAPVAPSVEVDRLKVKVTIPIVKLETPEEPQTTEGNATQK